MSTELFAGTTVRALMTEPVPPVATSTATRRRTSSAASAGSRSKFPSAKRDSDDVLMAIDTILTVAPGAQVVVHGAPFTGPGTSFQTLFNAMINDGVAIISNSFGYCEDQTTFEIGRAHV